MATSSTSISNREGLHPLKILLVDDVEENLTLLEDLFHEKGYVTVLARNGVEALQELRTQAISLIVADAMMPRMDGFQLCREVKRDPAFANIPLIIYTGNYVGDEERAFARSIGVDRYIVKYEGLAALVEAVDELSRKGSSAPHAAVVADPLLLEQRENSTGATRQSPDVGGHARLDDIGDRQSSEDSRQDSSMIVDDLGFLEKHHAIVVRKLEEKMEEMEMYAETLARKNRELQAAEARYRSFFEHAGIAIFVLDRVSGKVLDVNKEGVKLLGFSKAEFREMARLPFLDQNGFTTAMLETKNFFAKEIGMRRKDGKVIDVVVGPVEQSEDTKIMLYIRDVTEQRKMREQLQQAEKVALMGRLAAGIAHEIRNPLAAVTVNLQFLAEKYGAEFIDRHSLEMALEGAHRIEQVIENTLNLARLTPPLLAQEQVNDLVNRTLWFLKIPLQRKGLKVQMQLAENLPSITVDAKQIQQVILNLMQNAIDASPVGGVIIVSTELAGGTVDARSPSPAQVVVTIRDSGPGIPTEELEHLFEPFRSTKAYGTGLGLALSKQILDRQNATIHFASVEGKGTTVKIAFPITLSS